MVYCWQSFDVVVPLNGCGKNKKNVCVLISKLLAGRKGSAARSRLQPINGYFSIFLFDVAFVISLQIGFFKTVHRMERLQMFFSNEKLQ